jgi:predicted amidophosphoribosyltransferase
LKDTDWTKLLGWPGYRVWRQEIDETAKTLKLWVRRKRGNKKLICSGCGKSVSGIHEVCEREVRTCRYFSSEQQL